MLKVTSSTAQQRGLHIALTGYAVTALLCCFACVRYTCRARVTSRRFPMAFSNLGRIFHDRAGMCTGRTFHDRAGMCTLACLPGAANHSTPGLDYSGGCMPRMQVPLTDCLCLWKKRVISSLVHSGYGRGGHERGVPKASGLHHRCSG